MFDFQGAANFRFLFYYRCSDIGIPFTRSENIRQCLKPLLYKDYMNTNLTTQNKMPAHNSSHADSYILGNTDVGLLVEDAKQKYLSAELVEVLAVHLQFFRLVDHF